MVDNIKKNLTNIVVVIGLVGSIGAGFSKFAKIYPYKSISYFLYFLWILQGFLKTHLRIYGKFSWKSTVFDKFCCETSMDALKKHSLLFCTFEKSEVHAWHITQMNLHSQKSSHFRLFLLKKTTRTFQRESKKVFYFFRQFDFTSTKTIQDLTLCRNLSS